MQVIDLNRRFVEWTDTELPDPEIRRAFGLEEGGIGWDELLLKRRVVILAEAGSGKSTELKERTRLTEFLHQYAFYATVGDVGRDGLERSLSVRDRQRLHSWRTSAEHGWFFIDSVDEAKLNGIRLERVLRHLADALHGGEQRAHLILSGRLTDWEFRKDVESLKEWLPVSSEMAAPAVTSEDELLRLIRQEKRSVDQVPAPESPFVAVMSPLDRGRVRRFAEGKATPNLDRLLEAIESAGLWHFARRPLDLDWLVRFWQSESRLGSLAEMIERSVSERLKETNNDRARADALDGNAALRAVERISAAMVFGRVDTIAIPDSEIDFRTDTPLDLAEVLPEWSNDNRIRLLSRPIFDPATLGRARLHNDNEGVVRGYLAARWLLRLRQTNLSKSALFDLLFAKSYGLKVIRPSLNETAAWLSLWDLDVANEVIRRGPSLLLESADPASLALDVRRKALTALIEGATPGSEEFSWWNDDKLRRFAQPDLGPTVIALWPAAQASKYSARLLLRLVWLGGMNECADIARDAVVNSNLDPMVRVFAGRALLATADEKSRQDYARLVVTERSALPRKMVRESIMELFPDLISVQELLSILETTDVVNDEGGLGFDWEGPKLVEKLNNPSDLKQLLQGMIAQMGGELTEHAHDEPSKREEAYFPSLAAAALRILQLTPADTLPEVAIDAILRVGNRRDHRSAVQASVKSALAEVHRSGRRRRDAFWRVAQSLRRLSPGRQPFDALWRMQLFGYPPNLQRQDFEWLLEDTRSRDEFDRLLGLNAAISIYRSTGEEPALLERITASVKGDALATAALVDLTVPRQSFVDGDPEFEREMKERDRQAAAERDERDQSWLNFVRDLRSDPERIAKLKIPQREGVNPELIELWRLLSSASRSQSRYAIDSIAPLERVVGAEVAEAVRRGLISHWRNSPPLLRSQRPATERNIFRCVDLMGLAGVSLEAAGSDGWADQLSPHEATLAAGHATLELNGFPRWLTELAASRPTEVRDVLFGEIAHELTCADLTHCDTLQRVVHAGDTIAALLAPAMLDYLEGSSPVSGVPADVLRVIVSGIPDDQKPRFIQLGLDRFETEPDLSASVQYLAAFFSLDPHAATESLAARLVVLDLDAQRALLDRFLMATFGDSMSGTVFKASSVPSETLDELVRLTFHTQVQSPSQQRPPGKVFRMNENDYADQARSMVFNHLVKTPGAATYQALMRLRNDPNSPVSAERMLALAEKRAVEDSERAPWIPSEALAFEQHHETAPRTPKDLQSLILNRLDDLQHELLDGDFSQGLTLKALPKEVDVQNWVAYTLRLKQGRAYSVEREPHVAGEKEPDIRVRAKATDASIAIEIKVAGERWTLKDLDEALEVQLCGRYLRACDARYGLLLVVHQEARAKGWEDTATGNFLSFPDVVARLSSRADIIAGLGHDSPQPEVCVLDVSACKPRT